MPDRDTPGLDDPSGRFSVLSGSGARPGGAGGMDFADLVGAVQRIVDDPEAMATLRRYLDEGRDLRPALEATAETVPSAAPSIERLLANPGLVDDLGADSLDTVELVMALEEAFSIEIPDEDAEKIKSIGDTITYVMAHAKK